VEAADSGRDVDVAGEGAAVGVGVGDGCVTVLFDCGVEGGNK
jgi:hypothetical protein